MKFALAALAATTALSAPAAAYTVDHNSAPASGWFYGNGNNYSPSNASVLTTDDGDQIALRFHETYERAPASANGVYSFALGTSPLSFDWSFTNNSGSLNISTITLTNVGTGQTYSYAPILGNYVSGNTTQNSFRFNWVNDGLTIGGVSVITAQPGFFTPGVDSTYRVSFDNSNPSARGEGPRFLEIDAVFGAGAAVPEPGTWALLILGFGLVGGAMRRRTRTTVAFA